MWMKDLFGRDKPVIGLVHMHAMPTDPKYDAASGVQGVLEAARKDLHALQDGGIDGVLFCNEFSIASKNHVHHRRASIAPSPLFCNRANAAGKAALLVGF